MDDSDESLGTKQEWREGRKRSTCKSQHFLGLSLARVGRWHHEPCRVGGVSCVLVSSAAQLLSFTCLSSFLAYLLFVNIKIGKEGGRRQVRSYSRLTNFESRLLSLGMQADFALFLATVPRIQKSQPCPPPHHLVKRVRFKKDSKE